MIAVYLDLNSYLYFIVASCEGQIDDETQFLSFLLQHTHEIKRSKDFWLR